MVEKGQRIEDRRVLKACSKTQTSSWCYWDKFVLKNTFLNLMETRPDFTHSRRRSSSLDSPAQMSIMQQATSDEQQDKPTQRRRSLVLEKGRPSLANERHANRPPWTKRHAIGKDVPHDNRDENSRNTQPWAHEQYFNVDCDEPIRDQLENMASITPPPRATGRWCPSELSQHSGTAQPGELDSIDSDRKARSSRKVTRSSTGSSSQTVVLKNTFLEFQASDRTDSSDVTDPPRRAVSLDSSRARQPDGRLTTQDGCAEKSFQATPFESFSDRLSSQWSGQGVQEKNDHPVKSSSLPLDFPPQSRPGQRSRRASDPVSSSEQNNDGEPDDGARTTLMIRNIPNWIHQEDLLKHILSVGLSCDYMCLPLCRSQSRTRGYCFVNFTTAEQASQFMATFNGYQFHKDKKAMVGYAKWQGRSVNLLLNHHGYGKKITSGVDLDFTKFTRQESMKEDEKGAGVSG